VDRFQLEPVEDELEEQISQHQLIAIPRDDPKFASGRIAVVQYAAVAIFIFLISGFWVLQISNPEFYNARAESNRIKAQPIIAPRGRIFDRDGRLIVDNHSSYSVMLSREALKREHLKPIADGLGLAYEELVSRVDRFARRPKYEAIVIKEELTAEDLAFVEAHRHPDFFPELELIHSQRRLYPQNGVAAHVIGYTGEVSEAELDNPEFARYDPGDVIGKFGIERQYNEWLKGVDGERQVVVDNRGQVHQVLGQKDAIAGKDLRLTIDLELQVVAELAMEGRKGAVIALDPRNGEVLAMVSRPTFDPNKFAVRIKHEDWQEIVGNRDNPLLNRAIQAQLAPGSTFKPLMALAGLEAGVIDDGFAVSCPGGASFYGHYFRCHTRHGGGVALLRGIAQSCDVYFYNVGNRLGIDRIAFYAEKAGLGSTSGIDLPHETEGTVPSTQWKIRRFRQKWYAGETISVAIGQGALTVSPLQLARAIGGISQGGVWHHPHLRLDLTKSEKPDTWPVSPENVQKVLDGMEAAVSAGTGVRARIPGLAVGGKTGTSQLASNAALRNLGGGRDWRDNAWFVGLAPKENTEIVVVALFEHGEHGNLAAPIVRDVIKAHFDKKARQGTFRYGGMQVAKAPQDNSPATAPAKPEVPADNRKI
jgi:penicillin-binding protein 2